MATATKFGFSLSNIETLEFATFEENIQLDSEAQQTISLGIGHSVSTRNIKILTKVSFSHHSLPFLVIASSCDYEIHEEAWKESKQSDGAYIIRKQNIQQLIFLSIDEDYIIRTNQ